MSGGNVTGSVQPPGQGRQLATRKVHGLLKAVMVSMHYEARADMNIVLEKGG